jgi:hypothetical protein
MAIERQGKTHRGNRLLSLRPLGATSNETFQYFYLRRREPAIYSRIEIENVYVSRRERTLSIRVKRAINPDGERVLYTVPDIPYEVSTQRSREVRKAFRAGRRPLKPDLPRLIQEARQKESIEK